MDDLPDLELDADDDLSHADDDSDLPKNWDMGAVESIATNPRNPASIAQTDSNSTMQKKPFNINKISLDGEEEF